MRGVGVPISSQTQFENHASVGNASDQWASAKIMINRIGGESETYRPTVANNTEVPPHLYQFCQ